MMKLLGVVLVVSAGALAGCSSLSCGDPHPYLNSGTHPPLKAPPGLTVPALDPAYAIAGVASNTGKRTDLNAAGACLINPPQVVPTASESRGKPAETGKGGAAQPPAPAIKPEPVSKPAASPSTSAPAASTSISVL